MAPTSLSSAEPPTTTPSPSSPMWGNNNDLPYPGWNPYHYPPPGGYVPAYAAPCKCEYANQIRYYNHRSREFYYHNAVEITTETSDDQNSTAATNASSSTDTPFRPFYYDPYAAFGPHPVPPLPPHLHHPPAVHPGHHVAPYYYTESGICEFVLVSLALCLWLYSFYRLYLVWQNTLNFSESSIQGPQGWDLLVTWIAERIRLKKLASRLPTMSTRRKGGRRTAARNAAAAVHRANVIAASQQQREPYEGSQEEEAASTSKKSPGDKSVIRPEDVELEIVSSGGGCGNDVEKGGTTTKVDVCCNSGSSSSQNAGSFDYENPVLGREQEQTTSTRGNEEVEVACDGDHMRMYLGSLEGRKYTEKVDHDDEGLNSIIVEK